MYEPLSTVKILLGAATNEVTVGAGSVLGNS